MSRIPVPEGGFRSWLSKNGEKPTKSVLYEQKYQDHHDRIRNKENMPDERKKQSPSNFVSFVNPIPTAEDIEKHDDETYRLRYRAREMRMEQRRASNSSSRNSLDLAPESPKSDQYFTPKRSSNEGVEDEFMTPSTSKKDRRREQTPSKSDYTRREYSPSTRSSERRRSHSRRLDFDLRAESSPSTSEVKEPRVASQRTPLTSKPPRFMTMEQHLDYSSCLSRKMEQNFARMQELVFGGKSMKEARERALEDRNLAELSSSRRSAERRAVPEKTTLTRSSSQPPPIETLNSVPSTATRPLSPMIRGVREEAPAPQTSYVDHLVAAHRMQMYYADQVSVSVERQMTKLESMKLLQNLAALSQSPAAKRREMTEKTEKEEVESEEVHMKKLAIIEDIKARIGKLMQVRRATHKLVSTEPFPTDSHFHRLLLKIDDWIGLPFAQFDEKTFVELQALSKKMVRAAARFNSLSAFRNSCPKNRSFGRKSICMRVGPLEPSSSDGPSTDSTLPPSVHLPTPALLSETKDASTQVSARYSESAMTQTSPRRLGVEPLDLSSLQPKNSVPAPPSEAVPTPKEPANVQEIDDMLKNIVLRQDESLETVDHSMNTFKTDISFPISEECTPRSARVSLDSDSARRLSSGVAFYLEKIKQENQSSDELQVEVKVPEVAETQETVVSVDISTENPTEETTDNTAHSVHDEVEIESPDADKTQFEHEKEEEEEHRQLRESAPTPAPPVQMGIYDPEDDVDETKKFVDELDEENESINNESADDSGFLLNSKPAPRLKSIFDNTSSLQRDTPRMLPDLQEVDETTFEEGMDVEDYCRNEFLKEISPIMIQKALELRENLRDLDWVAAQSIWQPPSFVDLKMDFYDQFDIFDSFSIVLWGAVVDLLNKNYSKFKRPLTEDEKKVFEKDGAEMLDNEYGPKSRGVEWSNQVKMDKKLSGMMPFELDYRLEGRKGLSEHHKQKYVWQQVQMSTIADRYPRKVLIGELNDLVKAEKIRLGDWEPSSESEIDEAPPTVQENDVGVSDV